MLTYSEIVDRLPLELLGDSCLLPDHRQGDKKLRNRWVKIDGKLVCQWYKEE